MQSDVSCVLCLPAFSSELSCVSVQVFSVCLHVFACFCAGGVCLFNSFGPDVFGGVGMGGDGPRPCVCVCDAVYRLARVHKWRRYSPEDGGDTPPNQQFLRLA